MALAVARPAKSHAATVIEPRGAFPPCVLKRQRASLPRCRVAAVRSADAAQSEAVLAAQARIAAAKTAQEVALAVAAVPGGDLPPQLIDQALQALCQARQDAGSGGAADVSFTMETLLIASIQTLPAMRLREMAGVVHGMAVLRHCSPMVPALLRGVATAAPLLPRRQFEDCSPQVRP